MCVLHRFLGAYTGSDSHMSALVAFADPQRGPLRGILSRPGDPPLPSYYDVPLPASRGTAPGRYKLPQRRCTVAPSVVDLSLVRFTGEATPSVRLLDAMKEDRRYLILGKDDAVSRATLPEQKVTFCLEVRYLSSWPLVQFSKVLPVPRLPFLQRGEVHENRAWWMFYAG